ncbi:MAG: LysM peptidoglycan-binding domain-containing protein [Chloroflexi bacterium]|nr:LysM peptidoglycan-binding domain-containing protein [Chloroflexota bacterium]
MKRLISIALALILSATLAGRAAASGCASYYTVRAGDTLSAIGLRHGVGWPSIQSANGLANANLIYIGQSLCIPGTVTAVTTATPTFTIVGVAADRSATIRTANFPATQTFEVLMGAMGTHGVNGTSVGSTNSGAGGTFTATYNIPANLRGARQIAIRLQSATGFFSYNWFWNSTYP